MGFISIYIDMLLLPLPVPSIIRAADAHDKMTYLSGGLISL